MLCISFCLGAIAPKLLYIHLEVKFVFDLTMCVVSVNVIVYSVLRGKL